MVLFLKSENLAHASNAKSTTPKGKTSTSSQSTQEIDRVVRGINSNPQNVGDDATANSDSQTIIAAITESPRVLANYFESRSMMLSRALVMSRCEDLDTARKMSDFPKDNEESKNGN